MLKDTRLSVLVPVKQLARAAGFYAETLGLEPAGQSAEGRPRFRTRGADIELFEDEQAAASSRTLLSFEVKDVEEGLRRLQERGVRFEEYDDEARSAVDHVATLGDTKAAWFRDFEGNVLCIHQRLGA